MPPKEWLYRGARLEGDNLRAELQVFAGIDVGVTLNGAVADEVTAVIPTLEFIFRGVGPWGA